MSFRVVYKWKHEQVINHKAKIALCEKGKKGRRRNDQEAFYAWICIHSKIRSTKMLDFYSRLCRVVRDSSSSTNISFFFILFHGFWILVQWIRISETFLSYLYLDFHLIMRISTTTTTSNLEIYCSIFEKAEIWDILIERLKAFNFQTQTQSHFTIYLQDISVFEWLVKGDWDDFFSNFLHRIHQENCLICFMCNYNSGPQRSFSFNTLHSKEKIVTRLQLIMQSLECYKLKSFWYIRWVRDVWKYKEWLSFKELLLFVLSQISFKLGIQILKDIMTIPCYATRFSFYAFLLFIHFFQQIWSYLEWTLTSGSGRKRILNWIPQFLWREGFECV